MAKIYIIIVTYNGESWIRKCLQSLQNSTIPVHVIVIDNCSSDNTSEIIRKEYKDIEFILSDSNLGFGKANNIGIRLAVENNADYVFLLNQDAWIEPDTLKILVNAHQESSGIGIISPIHLNGKGDALDANFLSYMNADATPEILSDAFLSRLQPLYETRFVNAAAWLISRECFLKVGGFDPVFNHYGEDEDYIKRVYFHNFKVAINTECYAFHDRKKKEILGKHHPDEINLVRYIVINLMLLKNLHKPFFLNIFSLFRLNFIKGVNFLFDFKFIELRILLQALVSVLKKLNTARQNHYLSKNTTAPFI